MRRTTNRRTLLRAGVGGLAGLAGGPMLAWAQGAGVSRQALTGNVSVIRGMPGNVVVLETDAGAVLVDSGAAANTDALLQQLAGTPLHTLYNTHYHAEHTGGNAVLAEAGATIRAQTITRQWLSSDYYVPAEDRWVSAPPPAARPTETFREHESLTIGGQAIEAGYLLEAHTRGDIYVYLRDANVLAVGDVVSPVLDPALDWYAGGWLGGRVDALDDLLEIADNDTRIVPGFGPVMSRADLQQERDMMWQLYETTARLVNGGRSAEDMLEAGVLNEVDRIFDDPYRFLYDVAKGLWAHYTNFGGNTV